MYEDRIWFVLSQQMTASVIHVDIHINTTVGFDEDAIEGR